MRRKKELYVEVEQIDWDRILEAIYIYPFGVIVFSFVAIVNFIRYTIKCIRVFIIAFIPILNVSIGNDWDNLFTLFDTARLDLSWLKKKKLIVKSGNKI